MPDALGVRDHAAIVAMRAVNAVSRRTGRGDGTVAGGRVALRLAPGLAERLSSQRDVVLVSGTNGKTTTTACVTAALRLRGAVVTNATGANMLPGHVAALGRARGATSAVLECDEVWLGQVLPITHPKAVILLNLSRDQLDRTSEVRRIAMAWHAALESFDGLVVANADDPLVVYAAIDAPSVAWFAGGLAFERDAVACPRCTRRLSFEGEGWRCECGLARPTPDARPTELGAVVDGKVVHFDMSLPGGFNHANGVAALLVATRLGAELPYAARAVAQVTDVAGRFRVVEIDGVPTRFILAKNPAGFAAVLDLLEGFRTPVVIAINARVADGLDPSWLYDVDFERLADRRVLATGDRWRDLSARLFYAGVDHECVPDPRQAIAAAVRGTWGVDVVANYTAFADLQGSL